MHSHLHTEHQIKWGHFLSRSKIHMVVISRLFLSRLCQESRDQTFCTILPWSTLATKAVIIKVLYISSKNNLILNNLCFNPVLVIWPSFINRHLLWFTIIQWNNDNLFIVYWIRNRIFYRLFWRRRRPFLHDGILHVYWLRGDYFLILNIWGFNFLYKCSVIVYHWHRFWLRLLLWNKKFFIDPFPKQQILHFSKLKEFADDNLKFDENGRKLSKRVENTVAKGEIADYERLLL